MLRFRRYLFTSLLLCGLLYSTNGIADSLVVFSAKGTSYKSGAVVDGSTALTLLSGQEISLISPTGKIIKLVGPYQGLPMKKGDGNNKKSVQEAIKNLLSNSDGTQESFGITRSADDLFKMGSNSNPLPSPWMIDVANDGPYCFHERGKIVFWRADKSKTSNIKVKIPTNGWQADTVWSAGKSKLALPNTMPVHDGSEFQVTIDGKMVKGEMNLVPGTLQSEPAQAAWLKAKGCMPQFQALVRSYL